MTEITRYQFGPLEHRGLIGGLRLSQVVLIGGALVAAVGLLYALPTGPNAFAALAVVLMAAAIAFWPLRGRSLEEWLPVVFAWLGRRLRGRHRHRSSAPTAGARVEAGTPNGDGPEPATPEVASDLPDAVGAVEILSVPYRGGAIGAVKEGTLFTAILQCRVRAFGLLDSSEQERRLAGWGELLASFAGERVPVRRLQWVERTVPSHGDEVARYFSEHRDRAVPLSAPSIRSYIELIDAANAVTQDHELFVAIQLDARRARGAIRKLVRAEVGDERGKGDRRARERQVDRAACDLLRREAETLVNRLELADVRVEGALPPPALNRCIRDAYDPYGRVNRTRLEALEGTPNGTGATRAWPVGAEESWDRYQTDSALHVTYWIAQWPRVEVGASFLSPLLMQTPVLRSVSVTLEPIPLTRSMRVAEQAMTSEMADEAVRERHGFITSARKRLQQQATSRREEELAAGHAEMRMAGFVTVSAPDEDELDRACAEVEHAAQQAHIEIERMYGQQATAFTFSLPLCRGLA